MLTKTSLGIIPAYAGSTSRLRRDGFHLLGSSPHTRGALDYPPVSFFKIGDHPRIRGEHGVGEGSDLRRVVDHPRIRGEHPGVDGDGADRLGIIPAYAGSTLWVITLANFCRGSSPHTRGAPPYPSLSTVSPVDHPRIRGEHGDERRPTRRAGGIIPAYAGSTTPSTSAPPSASGSSPHTRGALGEHFERADKVEDHPRIRGEHLALAALFPQAGRIIPAYAGSTPAAFASATAASGSSPHTRGAPTDWTPAPEDTEDHPRIRGEHSSMDACASFAVGIIPAYAGSTIHMENALSTGGGSSPHTRGALTN